MPSKEEWQALKQIVGEKLDPIQIRDMGLAIVKGLPRDPEQMFLVAAAMGFATQFWHLGMTAHQHLMDPSNWDQTTSLSDQLDMAIQIGQEFGVDLGMFSAKAEGEG